jgi:hypothetical protein
MAQVAMGDARVRGGVLNPNMGLEDWDEWNNYLPTFSLMFDGASPGRVLGGEAAWALGDSGQAFAFGGADLDFAGRGTMTPLGGGGAFYEADSWATWSGVAVYPADEYWGVFAAVDCYPLDALWLSIDGGAGTSAGEPYAGGQLVVNVLPEAMVAPVARGELIYDPGGAALGLPDGTASAGARVAPLEGLQVALEVKAVFADGETTPGAYLSVQLFEPEPGPYTALEEE